MNVEQKILRLPDVLVRVPVSKSKLYKLMNEGVFPRPVRLGGVAVWRADDVEEWLKSL